MSKLISSNVNMPAGNFFGCPYKIISAGNNKKITLLRISCLFLAKMSRLTTLYSFIFEIPQIERYRLGKRSRKSTNLTLGFGRHV